MSRSVFDQRPIVVAIAGPNGAGKSTFFEARLLFAGLRFVNADAIARELEIGPYDAADVATDIRRDLVNTGESFVFETVLSDPDGEKVELLGALAERGYTVVLCFVGLESVELSDERVAIRAAQGGHDVPREKLEARYPRTLKNLERAIMRLPHVLVLDNSVFGRPHRLLAEFEQRKLVYLTGDVAAWFRPLVAPFC